ncbi:MAG: TRAP transporter large permease [Burkholderiales bacterium]|nr:MAG: TRAP transporter large permease [Burkholderiales bacterium]
MQLALIVAAALVVAFLSLPIASTLGLLALVLDETFTSGRLSRTFGGFVWDNTTSFALLSIPLFILMGEIVLRGGIAERMYGAVSRWVSWLPGGLMHTNIGSCAMFAATSGSSVATAATVGTVAYGEIAARRYNESLFLGSIAAGGTLGILIPPSVVLIVYGVLTQTSIPELYLAGIVPGLLLMGLYMAVIVAACLVRPATGGIRVHTKWSERIRALPDLAAPLALFLGVVGSIYAGLATPTEAASIGVVVSLALVAARRRLNWAMLRGAFEGTVRTTAMLMLIVIAAMLLNVVLGFIGVIQSATQYIGSLGLTPLATILIVVAFYFVLGMFMETFSMMLTTIGIVFPIVTAAGFDGVWFGIVVTLLMEVALITPPIGLNLFVVHGIRERGGDFRDVCIGVLPFVAATLVLIGLMIAFPQIALWLPRTFY